MNWKHKHIYVSQEGEVITKQEAKQNYKIVKTNHYVTRKDKFGNAWIEHTHYCEHKRQQTIEFRD